MLLTSVWTKVSGVKLHALTAGEGPPIVLLHGWPTQAFLWRRMMPRLAAKHRVIAIDLPGFGDSDKPLDASYSFRYYREMLDGALEQLGVAETGLVVHDLGGPAGLYWASQQPERVTRLGLTNTLIYPEISLFLKGVILGLATPGLRAAATHPWSIRKAIQVGMADASKISKEDLAKYSSQFQEPQARRALAKAITNFSPKGFEEVAGYIKALKVPARMIYGRRDWALPDIANTVARLRADLPAMEITELADCGHFLQEERPEEVAEMLAVFFEAEK